MIGRDASALARLRGCWRTPKAIAALLATVGFIIVCIIFLPPPEAIFRAVQVLPHWLRKQDRLTIVLLRTCERLELMCLIHCI